MKVQALKANGTRGEVTPLVTSRSDTEFFKAAVRKLENFVCLRYGGFRRRSGTKYRGGAKLNGSAAVFIPFVFSSTQAYMLEFGHQYVRFWTPDGLRVMDGGSPYEIVSPYTAADVGRLQFAQNYDIMYLAHPSYAPRKLLRSGHTNWAFSQVDMLDGPYLNINDTTTTATPSAAPTTGATITITMSATTGVNGGQGFLATDVGRAIRFQFNGNYSWGVITARSSATVVSVLIREGNGGVTPTITWRLGAFSQTTGYPGSVSFTEGRLGWGRTNANPNGVGLSRSGLPETFSPSDKDGTVVDSHGTWYDINNGGEIVWMHESTSRLMIGTYTSLRTLGASSGDEVLTPRNIKQRLEQSTGVAHCRPAAIGSSIVHAGRYGRTIRDCFYDYNINAFAAPALSTLAEHMFKSGVANLAYAQEPDTVLWGYTNDGNLFGTTFDREERVIGFHRHPMTNAVVESMAVVPDAANKRDVVFLLVRRTINGNTVRYVETLEPLFDSDIMTKSDAFFVDCGVTYSGSPVGTVTGLGHLEGQQVDILADGAVYPRQTVTSGSITLPNSRTAAKIHIGIPIYAYGETLTPVPEKSDGSMIGEKQRIVAVIANVFETLGLKLGTPGFPLDLAQFTRAPSVPMGQSPPLYTGPAKAALEGSWDGQGYVSFACDQPLPATILSLNIGVDV